VYVMVIKEWMMDGWMNARISRDASVASVKVIGRKGKKKVGAAGRITLLMAQPR
jgi:hypothetical protein